MGGNRCRICLSGCLCFHPEKPYCCRGGNSFYCTSRACGSSSMDIQPERSRCHSICLAIAGCLFGVQKKNQLVNKMVYHLCCSFSFCHIRECFSGYFPRHFPGNRSFRLKS